MNSFENKSEKKALRGIFKASLSIFFFWFRIQKTDTQKWIRVIKKHILISHVEKFWILVSTPPHEYSFEVLVQNDPKHGLRNQKIHILVSIPKSFKILSGAPLSFCFISWFFVLVKLHQKWILEVRKHTFRYLVR